MNDNELRDAIADVCDPLVHFVASDGLPAIRTREPAEIADAVLDVVRPQIDALQDTIDNLSDNHDQPGLVSLLFAAEERERVLLGIIDRLMSDWVVSWQSEGPTWEVPGYRGPEPMSAAESAFFASLQETT